MRRNKTTCLSYTLRTEIRVDRLLLWITRGWRDSNLFGDCRSRTGVGPMPHYTTRIVESRKLLMQDNHKHLMKIITDPESSAQGFGEIAFKANTRKFISSQQSGKVIHFKKITNVRSNGFKRFTVPKINRQIVELRLNSRSIKLAKSWLKICLPGR